MLEYAFHSKKTHFGDRRHRARARLTDRRDPPVGFFFFLPRAREQSQRRAPATIFGGTGHRLARSGYGGDQEEVPHPYSVVRARGRHRGEGTILHGGRSYGTDRGFGLRWLPIEFEGLGGSAGMRGEDGGNREEGDVLATTNLTGGASAAEATGVGEDGGFRSNWR